VEESRSRGVEGLGVGREGLKEREGKERGEEGGRKVERSLDLPLFQTGRRRCTCALILCVPRRFRIKNLYAADDITSESRSLWRKFSCIVLDLNQVELGRFRLFLSMSIIDFFRLFSTISISVSMSIFYIIAISISIIFSQSCIYSFGDHVTWSFN
jgi:hypothetical protein